MDELRKLLEVVRRELAADDARVEMGGREPTGDSVAWAPLNPGWRVVALFDAAPEDLAKKAERLRQLVSPFGGAADRAVPTRGMANRDGSEPPRRVETAKQQELDEALDLLAERAGARAAVVMDERSPVLWGCSGTRGSAWDLDGMQRLQQLADDMQEAGVDPAPWLANGAPSADELDATGIDETVAQRWSHRASRIAGLVPEWDAGQWSEALQISRAIGAARSECRGGRAPERVVAHDEEWGVFAKGFAQLYLLTLIYDGPYSELHAEGPLVRALPHIETLVLSLPPVEPPTRNAKVIAFKR